MSTIGTCRPRNLSVVSRLRGDGLSEQWGGMEMRGWENSLLVCCTPGDEHIVPQSRTCSAFGHSSPSKSVWNDLLALFLPKCGPLLFYFSPQSQIGPACTRFCFWQDIEPEVLRRLFCGLSAGWKMMIKFWVPTPPLSHLTQSPKKNIAQNLRIWCWSYSSTKIWVYLAGWLAQLENDHYQILSTNTKWFATPSSCESPWPCHLEMRTGWNRGLSGRSLLVGALDCGRRVFAQAGVLVMGFWAVFICAFGMLCLSEQLARVRVDSGEKTSEGSFVWVAFCSQTWEEITWSYCSFSELHLSLSAARAVPASGTWCPPHGLENIHPRDWEWHSADPKMGSDNEKSKKQPPCAVWTKLLLWVQLEAHRWAHSTQNWFQSGIMSVVD